MSKALESAKLALTRWGGDNDVSTADVLREVAALHKIIAGGADKAENKDRDERPH